MNLVPIYKPKGRTPLQIVDLVRKQFPQYQHEKIGYAGRLDPLAHGVLLLMIGEETTKQREQYLNLPKAYECEVLFGVQTDTYDALGMLLNSKLQTTPENLDKEIKKFINPKLGKQIQPYPPFSSKPVNGKPLFWWAKANKLAEITIPQREIRYIVLH